MFERQAQHRRDQQHGREGREIERLLDPQRDHQDQDRERDRERQPEVDQDRRDRQEQDREDRENADREADVAHRARVRRAAALSRILLSTALMPPSLSTGACARMASGAATGAQKPVSMRA